MVMQREYFEILGIRPVQDRKLFVMPIGIWIEFGIPIGFPRIVGWKKWLKRGYVKSI